MDARQERGLQIAATMNIQAKGNAAWTVPSQTTLVKKYTVTRSEEGFHCTCPDFELRHSNCKHAFAVEFFLKRETTITPDGETTVTETRAVRVTYPQNWAAYNAAQTAEKELFCHLLRDLTSAVPEPTRGNGRPPVPISDALFAACFKVYSGSSSRRFMSDLRDAAAKGFVSRPYHFNTVLKVIENPDVTAVLQQLITATAAPLRSVETTFAVDSTGFGTQCYYRHFTAKYGHDQTFRSYVKLHGIVGTKTNVIAAATVTDRDSHDYPQFIPLVNETSKTFTVKEVSADKAYSGRSNVESVAALGASPFIPCKVNAIDDPKSPAWSKLFHLYNYRIDEFLPFYHQRSNSESTFSMVKRVFTDTLRSKGMEAQTNELLMLVIAHNIRTLVHSVFELGITVPAISGCTQTVIAAHEVR